MTVYGYKEDWDRWFKEATLRGIVTVGELLRYIEKKRQRHSIEKYEWRWL